MFPYREASFAFTDPAPQDGDKPRVITICPRYFTDPLTQNSLDAKEYIKDPKRGQNSWCQPGNNFRFFSVGGETLLHEMTHLDALAKAADYPADRYIVPRLPLSSMGHIGSFDCYFC